MLTNFLVACESALSGYALSVLQPLANVRRTIEAEDMYPKWGKTPRLHDYAMCITDFSGLEEEMLRMTQALSAGDCLPYRRDPGAAPRRGYTLPINYCPTPKYSQSWAGIDLSYDSRPVPSWRYETPNWSPPAPLPEASPSRERWTPPPLKLSGPAEGALVSEWCSPGDSWGGQIDQLRVERTLVVIHVAVDQYDERPIDMTRFVVTVKGSKWHDRLMKLASLVTSLPRERGLQTTCTRRWAFDRRASLAR